MPTINITTSITAPLERVFDLARSIDLHTVSTRLTQEKAISGVITGLIGLNDEVTWCAKHFGIRQTLSVRITEFQRPFFFRDVMQRGVFRRMEHEHRFSESFGQTLMQDLFRFEAPCGFLGRIAEYAFLTSYLHSFLVSRNSTIKAVAESEAWIQYLPKC